MTLVFSLPFCLLLTDGDYQIKMDDGEVDTIHLKKIVPKVFDERLPYRGFRKGELDNIKYLWIDGKKIEAEELANYSEFGIVTKYIDKQEKETIKEINKTGSIFDSDKLHSELRILDWIFYQVCKDHQKNWERSLLRYHK